MDKTAMYKLSYGLFVLTAKNEYKENGCIVNTVGQVTSNPNRVTVAVNKTNYTCEMIAETGRFNVSVLSEDAPFEVFKRFGFASGRRSDKLDGCGYTAESENGLLYLTQYSNAYLSCEVVNTVDCGTHLLFIADVIDAKTLSDKRSVTYSYYLENIKPKPEKTENSGKKGYVCKICGYVYEGDTLPPDFVCPICKHGAEDFEPIGN